MNLTTVPNNEQVLSYDLCTASIVFSIIETICFVIGVPGSAIVLAYFLLKFKDKSVSTLLYLGICFTDLLICLLTFPSALSGYTLGSAAWFNNKHFCNAWALIWFVSSKMSIFMIAVLSIARTVAVSFPLRVRLRRVHVAIPLLVYIVILIIQYTLPFLCGTRVGYSYFEEHNVCNYNWTDVFEYNSWQYWALRGWTTVVYHFLPLIAIVVSFGMTVNKLRKETIIQGGEDKKREATVTIVILTIIYILFNLPLVACGFFIAVVLGDNLETLVETFTVGKIVKFLFLNSVGMNSVCNVLVYFYRVKGVRELVRFMINKLASLWNKEKQNMDLELDS